LKKAKLRLSLPKISPEFIIINLILEGYKEGITEIQLSDLQKKESRKVKLEADMPPLIDTTDNTINPPDAKDTKDAKDSTDAKDAKEAKDTVRSKRACKRQWFAFLRRLTLANL
jgi:hypothetical protein